MPSLVAVLYQLTGDERWLREPYAPTRSRGMDDNTRRRPARRSVRTRCATPSWPRGRDRDGTPAGVPAPRGRSCSRLLDVTMGEPVPRRVRADDGRDARLRRAAPSSEPMRRAMPRPVRRGRHRRRRLRAARGAAPARAGRRGHRRWRGTTRSAAPGGRTATRAPASTPRATCTRCRSSRAPGRRTSASGARCSATCGTSPTPSTCAASIASASRSPRRSGTTTPPLGRRVAATGARGRPRC